MIRKKSAPAIDFNMYRHFAIATLAATLGLAIFADGEGREAALEQADQAQAEAKQAIKQSIQEKATPKLLVSENFSKNNGSLDSFYNSAAAPTDPSAGASSSAVPDELQDQGSADVPAHILAQMGLTPATYAKLSPAEKARIRAFAKVRTSEEQKKAIEQMTRDSARRSGNTNYGAEGGDL